MTAWGEQAGQDGLSGRAVLAASSGLAAGTLLPGVAFEQLDSEPCGEQTRTDTGTLGPDVSD